MTPLLQVSGLKKSFGGVEAVKDVAFDLRPGQLLALIGPNGAGKSTTFNCLNGQLKPDEGEIYFNPGALGTTARIKAEKEHDERSGDNRQLIKNFPAYKIWQLGVGRTFQVTATFPSMSVIENVQMVLISRYKRLLNFLRRARKQYETEAMALLDLVGLAEQTDTACSILAYGDLKRLELAMALANNPKLLLMDEPTAGMSGDEREALMQLTHKVAKERDIGVLFTEHDMGVVFGYADWIIVMHRGEIIAKGQGEEIRHNPRVKEVYLGKED